jgi:rubredoxin
MGINTYTCTKCGDSYTEDVPKLTTHSYTSEVTKEANCGNAGTITFTCTICHHSYTEDIPSSGNHHFTSSITKQPTCKEKGIRTYTCIICACVYNESIDKSNNHEYEKTIIKNATDTIEGERKYTCTVCNDSYTEPFLLSKVNCIAIGTNAFVKNGLGESAGYVHCTLESINLNQDNKITGFRIKLVSYTTVERFNNKVLFGIGIKQYGTSGATYTINFKMPNMSDGYGSTQYVDFTVSTPRPLTEGISYEAYAYTVT